MIKKLYFTIRTTKCRAKIDIYLVLLEISPFALIILQLNIVQNRNTFNSPFLFFDISIIFVLILVLFHQYNASQFKNHLKPNKS